MYTDVATDECALNDCHGEMVLRSSCYLSIRKKTICVDK